MLLSIDVKLNLDCRLPVDVLTLLERKLAARGECLDYLVEKLLLAEVGINIDRLVETHPHSVHGGEVITYAEYLQTK